MAHQEQMIPAESWHFLWVTDFPLFEEVDEKQLDELGIAVKRA